MTVQELPYPFFEELAGPGIQDNCSGSATILEIALQMAELGIEPATRSTSRGEDVFLAYFADQGLATEPTAFDGRSDYGPFIAVGIPAGGLFTGAEGIKTEEQAPSTEAPPVTSTTRATTSRTPAGRPRSLAVDPAARGRPAAS